MQETKWKGEKVKEMGEGYTIIYSGWISIRNSIEVIFDKEIKIKAVSVGRKVIELK